MTDVEVSWHARARARIAPHTKEDVGNGRHGYWRCGTWEEIAKIHEHMTAAQAEEDTLTAAIERVKAWKSPPREADPLDIEVFLALFSPERVCEWAATHFGPAVVAPIFVKRSLESEWAAGSRVLKRKKLPPASSMLRKILVGQNAEGRAACKAAVQKIWDEGDVEAHQHIAFGFFFDEDWRERALAEILDQAPAFSSMQLTLARDEGSTRKLLARREKSQAVEYVELVSSLGAGALPLLLELAPAVRGNDPHLSHALAMSVLVGDAPAKHLASSLSHPSTRDVIGAYFERNPALAKRALPHAAAGASRNAALAKALLLKIAGPVAHETTEPLVSLDDPAVPQVLRDAPWLDLKPALPNLGIDLAAWPGSVTLSEARVKQGLDWIAQQRGNAPEMTPDEVKHFLVEHGKDALADVTHEGKCIPLEMVLERFNAGKGSYGLVLPLLAKFGDRALPGCVAHLDWLRWTGEDLVAAIDDPRLAQQLVGSSLGSWHLAHPKSAAVGLLSVAHREPLAAILLRRLARAGHEKTILEVADTTQHGDAVRALLARDPRLDVVRVAAQKTTYACTRPRLRDGRPLGDDVLLRICEMLAMGLDEPYAGLDDVRRACDPRSLAEMAWDLATLADGNGKRRQQSRFPDWMRWSLRHFADDEVIRRMTPALKHATIYQVLEALAKDGERAALIELATAEERESVTGVLARVGAAKNATADELIETMLPTTQLDAEGTTTLAYGATTLRVGFDTTLAPFLYLGEKRLTAVPRAKPSDDPLAIRLAKEHWEELKEDVRAIANFRARSLENAMRTARRIPAAHFVAGWATHPLGKHHARGVVWAVERNGALVTFRVAEDSTLADIDDHELVLGAHEFVRVPHHAELDADLVNRWSSIFTDYGLIQPVVQLGRAPLPIDPKELEGREISRELVQPLAVSTYRRIVKQQRHYGARTLVRCPGDANLHAKTKWENSASWVTHVALDVHVNRAPMTLSTVDRVELAESLFVMRLLTEAT